MSSRLASLKAGSKKQKEILLPGTDEKVIISVLTANELFMSREDAKGYLKRFYKVDEANKDGEDNNAANKIFADTVIVNNAYYAYVLHYALRRLDDPKVRLSESGEEILNSFVLKEMKDLIESYNDIQNGTYDLELVTTEEFEEIKKYLEATRPNDLDGLSSVYLKLFLQTLPSRE
jgi:hypothetical protein